MRPNHLARSDFTSAVNDGGDRALSFLPDMRQANDHEIRNMARSSMEAGDGEELLAFFMAGTRDLQRENDRLRLIAERDALTGLHNKGAFHTFLENEIGRSKKFGHGVSVCLIDLDLFKSINDTVGHPAGDAVLKEVARLLPANLRKGDFIARTGGDEFSVIITDTDPATSHEIHTRLKKVFDTAVFEHEGRVLPVRASVGTIVDLKKDQTTADLLVEADKAMYAVKEAGKIKRQQEAQQFQLRLVAR